MRLLNIAREKMPEILTGISAGGVALTAWLTHRATRQADQIIEEDRKIMAEFDHEIEYTFRERAKLTWKCYILPVAVGLGTIASGIASNRVSAKRLGEAVAIGALYADRVKALEDRIEEKLGKEELAKVKEDIRDKSLVDIANGRKDGKMLCYEPESKQWFYATQQQLLMAEITANKIFKNEGKLTMNQWLQLLPGCKTKPSWGDEWGWWESDEEGYADFNWSFYRGAPWIDVQPQIAEHNGEYYLWIGYGMHPMRKDDNQILADKPGLKKGV